MDRAKIFPYVVDVACVGGEERFPIGTGASDCRDIFDRCCVEKSVRQDFGAVEEDGMDGIDVATAGDGLGSNHTHVETAKG